jgi:hypothetical protein
MVLVGFATRGVVCAPGQYGRCQQVQSCQSVQHRCGLLANWTGGQVRAKQ